MKAVLNGTVLAEAAAEELAHIEGNRYFPPSSLTTELFSESATAYTCPWKGAAQYWNAVVDGETVQDIAWSYPDLRPGAVEKVGKDFAGFVAFDRKVSIEE